jgi:uncharacterized protein (DUF488 family)
MTRVYTVGHSTLALEEFLDLLRSNRIERVVDVRRYPGSRRFPHFSREALREALSGAGIDYVHAAGLGGRRTEHPDSHNTAWRNGSFRAYADYMETAEFESALQDLKRMADEMSVVIMCAEALWWRCHRGLIADRLKSDAIDVVHIGTGGANQPHPYTSAARIVDGRLSYRGEG